MWNENQIAMHQKAANKLDQIMQASFRFIRQNCEDVTEYQVKRFIKQRLRDNGMVSEAENPIVSFGKNTSQVHYFAAGHGSKTLQEGDLVMIDLWARLKDKGSPYADITWTGVYGQALEKRQQTVFNKVIQARNLAIADIKESLMRGDLPISGKIDSKIRNYFATDKLQQFFLHTTGHALGLNSAHGRGNGIWLKHKTPLRINLGYTIEPGLYFQNDFGIRSEINFYITEERELIVTTTPQASIVRI